MSEEFNTQQSQDNTYQDPIASMEEKPKKKASSAADVAATVAAFALVRLFGVLGGLICYGGYWSVRAVIKSKMSVAVKVILSVGLVLVFFVLFIIFCLWAAAVREAL